MSETCEQRQPLPLEEDANFSEAETVAKLGTL